MIINVEHLKKIVRKLKVFIKKGVIEEGQRWVLKGWKISFPSLLSRRAQGLYKNSKPSVCPFVQNKYHSLLNNSEAIIKFLSGVKQSRRNSLSRTLVGIVLQNH